MYDVAIIGAGPAGSIAAIILAQAQYNVIFFDRTEFPRDKPCGDLVSYKAVNILREIGAGNLFDQHDFFPISKARIVTNRKQPFELPLHDGSYIAPRTQFDELLRQHAIACGATFNRLDIMAPLIEDGRVIGVRGRHMDGEHTTSDILARITIGAYGSSSSIGRFLGLDKQDLRHTGVAIRAYLEMDKLEHVVEGYLLSDFMPGYAWIFPVNQQVANVGIGTRADILKGKRLSLLQGLHNFLSSSQILPRVSDISKLNDPKTWMMRFGSQSIPRVYPGAILIGDAGSFVNPLTGEGIFPAMLTARLAAQVVSSFLKSNNINYAELTNFERLWKQTLAWSVRRDYIFQRLIEAWPVTVDVFAKFWQLRLIKNLPKGEDLR